ncbi:uncharacterized protein LOC131246369 isoform X2 [Magnolia sinica]|uniref:uncharacterized protein LOC131246369 isoform X2 n=1 Tax=Magnolia sinica TaxID=86752 RepID=UPI00265B350C|nr:uncharacterized protein LOC131246369 isoform X2 [Magnolia sinica]
MSSSFKNKVTRQANPFEDAAVVHEIRQKVGHLIKLRVDANRNWTYEEAVLFWSCVKCYDLQYIEVSGPSMHDDCFLEGAVARYKGLKFISGKIFLKMKAAKGKGATKKETKEALKPVEDRLIESSSLLLLILLLLFFRML